ALREYAYDAEIAGISYNIYDKVDGISVSVRGYNDKIPILLEKILLYMKNFTGDPNRFTVIKERLERNYRNSLLGAPYIRASYHHSCVFLNKMWTDREKLGVLEDITLNDVQLFYTELLAHLQIEALIHGNMLKDEALRLAQMVEDILRPKPLSPSLITGLRAIILPEGKNFIYQQDVYDQNNINSAIEYYIQGGDVMDVNLKAKFNLIAQISREPCFDQRE
ncbi:4153_t:CDS:1, partial [Acaulospora colombiana]